jgi:hypothetical protein
MKSIFSSLFIVLLLALQGQSQSRENISLRPFEKVQVSGNISVELVSAGKEEATLVTKGIDASRVSVNVEGRTLKIKLGAFEQTRDASIRVFVNYHKVREVGASSGASVTFRNRLEEDYMKITAGTGGSVNTEGSFRSLELKATGGSVITIEGRAGILEGVANTGGQIKASALICDEAVLKANTGGLIETTVMQSADASAGTGAEIILRGNPAKEKISSSLGGTITRIRE